MVVIQQDLPNLMGHTVHSTWPRIITEDLKKKLQITSRNKSQEEQLSTSQRRQIRKCADSHISFHLLFNSVSPHKSPSSVRTPKKHTNLVNSSLTTTPNHPLTPSFSVYFHEPTLRPSQAKVLTGGADLSKAQVDVPLSVSHSSVRPHSWAQ